MGYRIGEASAYDERRRTIGRDVAPRVLRFNQFDSQPNQEGFEHDERESRQEEVYVVLRGTGVLRVDGDEIPLMVGRYVLVEPGSTRQVVAGGEGLSYVVFGAVVDP